MQGYFYENQHIMTRIEVLNAIIQKKQTTNYLEIGVNRGKCLFKIKGAEKRLAVDPFFNFNLWKKVKACIKNPDNLKNDYFEVTSDTFFDQNKTFLSQNLIDLAFIDGLHTYKQSMKDTQNVLQFLNKNGIIILHDCNPLDAIAAHPANDIEEAKNLLQNDPNWKNIWNGDVWKTVVYIRKNYPNLTAFVLDTDHGLGIVYQKQRQELPDIFKEFEDIDTLDYLFFDQNRKDLIDLKPISYWNIFLDGIA